MEADAQHPEARGKPPLPLRTLAGEFLVIVAGVLCALAVDEWRQGLQERSSEEEYLDGLVEELRLNVGFLGVVGDSARARLEATDRILAALGTTPRPEPSIDYWPDSIQAPPLASDLQQSTRILTLFPARSVWEDLTNTGNLQLIEDFALRRTITLYYQLQDFAISFHPQLQARVESLAEALREAGVVVDWPGAGFDLDSLEGFEPRFIAAREAQVDIVQEAERHLARTRALLEEMTLVGYGGPS